MPDDRPKRVALEKAARFLLAAIRRRAPSARSADSFRIERAGADVIIVSRDMGTVMTETGKRHPVYARGPRDSWTWVAQNARHPGRTHFIEKAADFAAGRAAETFADEWARQFVAETEWEVEQ